MSGEWHGTYTYPGNLGPATPFMVSIADIGGSLSGRIIEPDMFYGSGTLVARLIGHRAGQTVDFTKTYEQPPVGYENPIDYVGSLSADGLTVTGVWSLLKFDGSFEMLRDAKRDLPVEVEEEESVPVPIIPAG